MPGRELYFVLWSSTIPPTMLIHGTKDTDVLYEQSLMMAELFEKYGIDHKFVTIPGAEHGLKNGDPKQIDTAYNSALDFINRYIKK